MRERHTGDRTDRTTVLLHAVERDVWTLGPGPAAVVWAQGCPLACRGCASVATWDPSSGRSAYVDEVARWVVATGHNHFVLSGGEPAEQAPALAALVDRVREHHDVVVTLYSGFALDGLRRDVRPGSSALVDRVDLVIDGPYVKELHAPLRWRASSNQRLHDLTGRVALPDDRPAGVAVVISADGTTADLVGVPEVPGLAREVARAMAAEGVPVDVGRQPRSHESFPFPTFPSSAAHTPARPNLLSPE